MSISDAYYYSGQYAEEQAMAEDEAKAQMAQTHSNSGAPMRQERSSEEKFWSKSNLVQAGLRDIASHFGSEVRELIADVLVKHHTGILEVLRELHDEKVRIRREKDAEIERLTHTVNLAASQKLPDEMDAESREFSDWQHGYEALVKLARAALAKESAP